MLHKLKQLKGGNIYLSLSISSSTNSNKPKELQQQQQIALDPL